MHRKVGRLAKGDNTRVEPVHQRAQREQIQRPLLRNFETKIHDSLLILSLFVIPLFVIPEGNLRLPGASNGRLKRCRKVEALRKVDLRG
jgi:hypothetical protein